LRYSLKGALISGAVTFSAAFAVSAASSGSKVTVVGANGRTGRKVVDAAIQKGYTAVAVTRQGKFLYGGNNPKIINIAADITKQDSYDSLKSALRSSKACIFTASASKDGGSPNEVDRDGLVAVAKACIDCKVPRFVIVSSGGVSKPSSSVYLFLNIFGGIMKAKIEGEDEVRKLYADDRVKSSKLSYTIIRPGGLLEDDRKGLAAIELNQGDERSGRIARSDVADIAIESLESVDAEDTTFECYYADTSQPLSGVGISNILKKTTKEAERELTGSERRGSSWLQLFKGLKRDFAS
jgi:uncharacterized protein YbjT (DUF2867 family)